MHLPNTSYNKGQTQRRSTGLGFATFASASRPNIHNDSEQKKYRSVITHMPVRAPLPIDNGQNNQYEIEKLDF